MPANRNLNPREAAAYMRISYDDFMALVEAGNIPSHRGNPHLTFRDDELFALPSAVLAARPPIDPIAARAALYDELS